MKQRVLQRLQLFLGHQVLYGHRKLHHAGLQSPAVDASTAASAYNSSCTSPVGDWKVLLAAQSLAQVQGTWVGAAGGGSGGGEV